MEDEKDLEKETQENIDDNEEEREGTTATPVNSRGFYTDMKRKSAVEIIDKILRSALRVKITHGCGWTFASCEHLSLSVSQCELAVLPLWEHISHGTGL